MKWEVPQEWRGQTCVIIAGGPSLGDERRRMYSYDLTELAYARLTQEPEPRIITVNDSWRLFPMADVFYFCDASWWHQQCASNRRTVDGLENFTRAANRGFWVTAGPQPPDHPRVHALNLTGQRGMEDNPRAMRHGSNSGYQAIHLAAHYGAKKIILLGFDMKPAADGRTHWHAESRPAQFDQTVANFLSHFPSLAAPLVQRGIEVINATPDSALKVWPCKTLQEALALKLKV